MSKSAIGSSHGKIILMGEHSVVYGEPAIALPFTAVEITAVTSKTEGDITISSDFHTGNLLNGPDQINNIKELVRTICQRLQVECKNFHIEIQSTIPAGRGLGSSAAVAGAIVRSLYNYFDSILTEEELLDLMDLSERICHGNPSGLDARITSSNHAVYFQKEEGMTDLSIDLDAYLIVGDTGVIGDTLSAVSDVQQLVKKIPDQAKSAIKKLGYLAENTRQAFLDNDASLIGKYMTKAHQYLSQLQVSNSNLDSLVKAATDAGALGAKLTGGGRGGCMIALADNKENAHQINHALKEAGALNTWMYSLETGDDNV